MFKDEKAGRMFLMLHCGHPVTQIARRLEMGESTIRKDRDSGILPSGERLAESNRDVARKVASIEKALGLNPESRV